MAHSLTRRDVIAGTVAIAAVPFSRAALAAGPVTHDIAIQSFAFDPAVIQVRIGDTIRWVNKDLAPHTATADEYGWDTGALERGDAGDVVVTKDMETTYFCVFHPHMKGRFEIVA